ncbi:unnamed protein product [Caenorhabditis bovis]|uniref:Uncharacterized protein n=1 Tax=Caenorhabditis bovis TaxID=2654633 RepID=A0A8S1ERR3_9PELO|nr:unnamed protein product [Caenorhabditis bovis]
MSRVCEKQRSSSFSDQPAAAAAATAAGFVMPTPTFNITAGLRSFHKASAFLPGFVVDNCNAQLDDVGFEFVQQCINILEEKGIHEQGVYRNCGVTSKVQKMMQLGLDRRKAIEKGGLNLGDDEWETKTISSAVKTFLRNLPEPLMTFGLHNVFINAAKMDDATMRIDHIHFYVHQLPPQHFKMLEIVIRHLRRVADLSSENLMTVSNLGVCFGPTLLRPKEETVAAIMDIKFCNVVVEVLISNYDKIFNSEPRSNVGAAVPPKPDHHTAASTTSSLDSTGSDNSRNSANRHTGTVASPLTSRSRSPKSGGGTASKIVRSAQVASSLSSKSSAHQRHTIHPTEISRHGAGFDVTAISEHNLSIIKDKSPTNSPSAAHSTSGKSSTIRLVLSAFSVNDYDEVVHGHQSSDSLNSLGSSVSVGDESTATVVLDTDSYGKQAVRTKYSVSYAPNYNRIPPESRRVKTLYSCTPDHESELSFEPGQIITNVYESKEDGWLVGTLNGKTGLIPSNYVETLP